MRFKVNSSGKASSSASTIEGFSGGNSMTYNVAANSFELKVAHPSVSIDETFTPSEIDSTQSNATVTVYLNGAGDRALIMLKPEESALDLSYVTFGNWTDIDQSANSVASGYVVFGIRTAAGAMPHTGTASYNGQTVGTMTDGAGGVFTVSGLGTLGVNFATGTVNGDFTQLAKVNVLTSPPTASAWRDFTTTSTISGNTFSGSAATKDGKLSGTNEGGFFGPAANEIGGVWNMTGNGETAVGAFVGKK